MNKLNNTAKKSLFICFFNQDWDESRLKWLDIVLLCLNGVRLKWVSWAVKYLDKPLWRAVIHTRWESKWSPVCGIKNKHHYPVASLIHNITQNLTRFHPSYPIYPDKIKLYPHHCNKNKGILRLKAYLWQNFAGLVPRIYPYPENFTQAWLWRTWHLSCLGCALT